MGGGAGWECEGVRARGGWGAEEWREGGEGGAAGGGGEGEGGDGRVRRGEVGARERVRRAGSREV